MARELADSSADGPPCGACRSRRSLRRMGEGPPAEALVRFVVEYQNGDRICIARCPLCDRAVRVNERDLGRPTRCARDECGAEFVVRRAPASAVTTVPSPLPERK